MSSLPPLDVVDEVVGVAARGALAFLAFFASELPPQRRTASEMTQTEARAKPSTTSHDGGGCPRPAAAAAAAEAPEARARAIVKQLSTPGAR